MPRKIGLAYLMCIACSEWLLHTTEYEFIVKSFSKCGFVMALCLVCSLWEKCKKIFCCLRLWNSFAVNTFASGDQSFTAFDRRSRPEINFSPHLGELRNFSWHSLQFKSVQFTFIWEGLFTGHEKCIWTILLQYIYTVYTVMWKS